MGSFGAERLATFEELYQAIQALPPGLTGEILEPGVIRTMGRPGGPHRFASRALWRSLGNDDAAEGAGRWWLEQEAEARFPGGRLAVPDLTGWRLGEGDAVPPVWVDDNPIELLPDWCCELLSPSTESIDREIKVPIYAGAGVDWIWLVDPRARRIEVLRSTRGEAELLESIEGDVHRAIPPFTSVVDTSRWWLRRPPSR